MERFALCKKNIVHNNEKSFINGHVYIVSIEGDGDGYRCECKYILHDEQDVLEIFPGEYFLDHFKIFSFN